MVQTKFTFYIVVISAICCGIIFPQAGALIFLVPYFIVLTLFLNFLNVSIQWDKILRGELFVTLLLTVIIMPFSVNFLLPSDFSDLYRIGLILVACSPGSIMTLIISKFIPRKDYNLIFSNFLVTNLAAVFYIPVILKITAGRSINIDILPVFIQTAAIVLLPYAGSIAAKKFLNQTVFNKLCRISNGTILVLFFLIIAASIGSIAGEVALDETILLLLIIGFIIYLTQGFLGYAGGLLWRKQEIKNTLAFISSSRNTQLVIAIVAINFPPAALIPIILCIFVHHLTNIFWLWLFKK